MPDSQNGLWHRVVSWDNLVEAYFAARQNKRFKQDIMRFHQRWEENLLNIHNHLLWGSWQPGPFSVFPVFEPKPRVIEAPPFADRIVHHAIHRVVNPYFERRFIPHSYACRKDKGTHRAGMAVQRFLRRARAAWKNVYVLQCDIKKYFPSIDHDIFMNQIRRTIRDRKLLGLWEKIVFDRGVLGVGLPVGALTSQLGANAHLDPLDHHVTDDLGMGFYVRYMDDFVIIGPSKAVLWDLLNYLQAWLWEKLRLEMSRFNVYPASQGVDFAGYRIWQTHRLPRKRNTRRARKRIHRLARLCANGQNKQEALRAVTASFYGYAKFCSSAKIWQAVEEDLAATFPPAAKLAGELRNRSCYPPAHPEIV